MEATFYSITILSSMVSQYKLTIFQELLVFVPLGILKTVLSVSCSLKFQRGLWWWN